MRRLWMVSAILVMSWCEAVAQQAGTAPVIDTIILRLDNIFGEAEAQSNPGFRLANTLHVRTRPGVVRRELLFRQGERYDAAVVAETARNLRALGIFRDVRVDTVRVNGRFGVLVWTADGWTTQLNFGFQSTGGRFTWSAGLAEGNFLGSATLLSTGYRKEVDRSAFTLGTRLHRVFGSRVQAIGFYDNLSDGSRGSWRVGFPFRSFSDARSFEIVGEAADRRILQYLVNDVDDVDTVRYQRRAFRNAFSGAIAARRGPLGYWRVGVAGQIRREEYLLQEDTALAVPDTISGAFGFFTELRRANFKVVNYFNGFGRPEDLDLSTVVRLSAWVAPSAMGYDRSGIGPRLDVWSAVSLPFGFARASVHANGLFTGIGLDSGTVAARATLGAQFLRRQATFVHVEAGMQKSPVPGGEFDLGHGTGPRSFAPHAFTGTRAVWGTVEHRVFVWDNLLGLLGLGFAGFLDYGGAWRAGESPRLGGNVGFGLRTGASRATGVNVGRIDIGYRFGDGWSGRRWVISTGRGFPF